MSIKISLLSLSLLLFGHHLLAQKALVFFKEKPAEKIWIKKLKPQVIKTFKNETIPLTNIDSLSFMGKTYSPVTVMINGKPNVLLVNYLFHGTTAALVQLPFTKEIGLVEGENITFFDQITKARGIPVALYNLAVYNRIKAYQAAAPYLIKKIWTKDDLIGIAQLLNDISSLAKNTDAPYAFHTRNTNDFNTSTTDEILNGFNRSEMNGFRLYSRIGLIGSYTAYWKIPTRNVSLARINQRKIILTKEGEETIEVPHFFWNHRLKKAIKNSGDTLPKGINISSYSFQKETMIALCNDLQAGKKLDRYPIGLSAGLGLSFRSDQLKRYTGIDYYGSTIAPFVTLNLGLSYNYTQGIYAEISVNPQNNFSLERSKSDHETSISYGDLTKIVVPFYWKYKKYSTVDTYLPILKLGLVYSGWIGGFSEYHYYKNDNTYYQNQEPIQYQADQYTQESVGFYISPGVSKNISPNLALEGSVHIETHFVDNLHLTELGFTLALQYINRTKK